MTPSDFFWGCLYVCGGCIALAFTLALLGVAVVAFVVVAGWIANTFRTVERHGVSDPHPGANGLPVRTINFATGQTATVPADTVLPPELST